MIGRPSLFGGGIDGARLVASAAVAAGGASPTPASLGAVVGDLAVVASAFGTSANNGSGEQWPQVNTQFSYMVMKSTDLPRTISVGGNDIFVVLIYRGAASIGTATAMTAKSLGAQSAPGFTPSAKHAGLIGCTINNNNSSTVDPITGPATWLSRNPGQAGRMAAYDRLYPVNDRYQAGTPIRWTANVIGDPSNSSSDQIYVVELLTA